MFEGERAYHTSQIAGKANMSQTFQNNHLRVRSFLWVSYSDAGNCQIICDNEEETEGVLLPIRSLCEGLAFC
jgi:hypothetical protein